MVDPEKERGAKRGEGSNGGSFSIIVPAVQPLPVAVSVWQRLSETRAPSLTHGLRLGETLPQAH